MTEVSYSLLFISIIPINEGMFRGPKKIILLMTIKSV